MEMSYRIDANSEVSWHAAAGVQPVVYVAKSQGRPIAILQLRPGYGFELTTCDGRLIGNFASLTEGQIALGQRLSHSNGEHQTRPSLLATEVSESRASNSSLKSSSL
jgi:hypothetical protein